MFDSPFGPQECGFSRVCGGCVTKRCSNSLNRPLFSELVDSRGHVQTLSMGSLNRPLFSK